MFPRFCLLFCLTTGWLLLPVALAQDEKEKPKKAKKEKADKPDKLDKKEKPDAKAKGKSNETVAGDDDEETDPMQGIGKLLPLGEKNIGVKAPTFDGGELKTLVLARTLTRESEQILFIEGLEMHRYGKTAASQLSIASPEACYFMESKLLFSDHRSRVTRSDFTLEGDELTFDNEHQRGKMVGNVVMEINSPEPKKPAPEAPPTAAADAKVPAAAASAVVPPPVKLPPVAPLPVPPPVMPPAPTDSAASTVTTKPAAPSAPAAVPESKPKPTSNRARSSAAGKVGTPSAHSSPPP